MGFLNYLKLQYKRVPTLLPKESRIYYGVRSKRVCTAITTKFERVPASIRLKVLKKIQGKRQLSFKNS